MEHDHKKSSVATPGFASGLALSSNGRYVYITDDDSNAGLDIVDPRALPVPTVQTFWLIMAAILVALRGGLKRKQSREQF